MRIVCLLLLILGMGIPRAPAEEETPKETKKVEAPPDPALLQKAMERGLAFLRQHQSEDGAFGSHDPVVVDSAQLAFGLLDFGSHDGMRIACTALGAKALLLYPYRTEADDQALQKAINHLFKHWKLAYDPGNAFNVWGYCYNLDFLTLLNRRPEGEPMKKRIKETIPKLIAGLRKMQVVEGGWAYYTSVMLEGDSISFITSNIMLALMDARDQGFELPEGMLEDAAKVMKSMIFPDKNIVYGTYLRYRADHALEDLSAGARTVVGGLALHRYDGTYTMEHLVDRCDHYFKVVDYVETIGNKRIIPHRDAPQNISGYFLYYGIYYAVENLVFLGDKLDRVQAHWQHVLRMILEHQEPEGCWWDTICYGYGDKWGTSFSLLCLEHYLNEHELWQDPVKKDREGE